MIDRYTRRYGLSDVHPVFRPFVVSTVLAVDDRLRRTLKKWTYDSDVMMLEGIDTMFCQLGISDTAQILFYTEMVFPDLISGNLSFDRFSALFSTTYYCYELPTDQRIPTVKKWYDTFYDVFISTNTECKSVEWIRKAVFGDSRRR